MGVGWPSPGGMIPGMQSLLCLPTWGGKGGLLLDSLGMAWGWAAWGSRHTDCRDSRLGTGPPEAPVSNVEAAVDALNGKGVRLYGQNDLAEL